MENYIKNIELINRYLNKKLSEQDIQDFENRLNTNAGFKKDYETHVAFLAGLKRHTLKAEISKAKTRFIRNKWFKYLGVIMAVLLGLSIIFLNLKSPKAKNNKGISIEIKNQKINVDTAVVSKGVVVKEINIPDASKTEKIKTVQPQVINNAKNEIEIAEVNIPKKEPQVITVNATKDTTIVCKEGTKLAVKANSFLTKNNRAITGKVTLSITEYYKISDLLLANLTTQSNGKPLETGGMLYVEAKHENKDVKLKENSGIDVFFPTKRKQDNMKLFSGTWHDGNINWELEKVENSKISEVDAKVVQESSIDVPYAIVEQAPIFPGCESGNTIQQRNCTSDEISKFVHSNFNTQIASVLGLTGKQRVNVIFKIDLNGDVIDVRSRGSNPDLEMEAERVVALLPKMTPGKQRGIRVSVPYSLPIIFKVDENTEMIANLSGDLRARKRKQDSFFNKKLEDKLRAKKTESVMLSEVNGYILRSLKLGWINCDRFIRFGNKINYKVKVENAKNTRVNLIFKSMYSVLPSKKLEGFYNFGDIPNNEEIILVAIKKDNGKLFLDIVETKTKENSNLKFNFKELSVIELRKQLKVLDSLFQ